MTLNRTVRLICISTVVGMLTALPAAPAFAAVMPPLAPQPLANALETIARQAGLQLIYSSSLSNGVLTRGSPAGLGWQDALRALLEGTGLTYQLVNEHTVTIVPDPQVIPGGSAASELSQAGGSGVTTESRAHARLGAVQLVQPKLDEIVITGSHIVGAPLVGGKVVSITRKEIDRSGYSTVQDVVRSLTQNFGGGSNEASRNGLEDAFNSSRATGLNLRGLGSESTLVLINGRRLAASGSDGRFVDVSGIPLSAIERIDVLPDGATAAYGADAVAGVVNFILRDDYEGAETQLKFGSVTSGATKSSQLAQLLGKHWDDGNALVSFEYYARDRLPNADRRQSENSDLSSLGGDNFDTNMSNPGTVTDGLHFWAVPHRQDGRSLTPTDFIAGTENKTNRNADADLLPQHKRLSMLSTVRQNLDDRTQLFFDALISDRRTEYQNPPARQALFVPPTNAFYVLPEGAMTGGLWSHYSFADDFGPEDDRAKVTTLNTALGATTQLGETWSLSGYAMYSSAKDTSSGSWVLNQEQLALALADPNPETAFNPFGDGSHTPAATLERIRDRVYGRRVADLHGANITAEGSLLRLANRDVRIALGADYRYQSLYTFIAQDEQSLFKRDVDRDMYSVFGELLIPLIPENTTYPGLKSAQLSLANRYEHYSDFGGATAPRFGLKVSPLDNLTLRASWARNLRAPGLTDLSGNQTLTLVDSQMDPLTGAPSPILLWTGGNNKLREETASTWSAGLDYEIPSRNLAVSLGYFAISFTNRISQVIYSTAFLEDPIYQDIVTRNPSAELRNQLCDPSIFVGNLERCTNQPLAAVVDMRLNNQAVLKTSGVDFSLNHEASTRYGQLASQLYATYLFEYGRARLRRSPITELLNTPENPVDIRVRGSLSWDHRGAGASMYVNFIDGYTDTSSFPRRPIDPWTTLDLQLRYGASPTDPLRFTGLSLALSVQNLLDQNPPFYNNPQGVGYDPSNSDLLGRLVSVQIRKAW